MTGRQGIIHEIKAELDAVAEEIAVAERALSSVAFKRGEVAGRGGGAAREAGAGGKRALEGRREMSELYARQDRASRRFGLISRACEIGCSQQSSDAIYHQLAGYLFRSSDDVDNVPGVQEVLIALAEALYAYFHVAFDELHERKLAQAWLPIETTLRGLGRDI